MAHTFNRSLSNLIGYVAWGDLGELTMYRSRRGKLVAFTKTYPDKPVSPEAEAIKTSFQIAHTLYALHGDTARQQWQRTPQRLSLCLSGGSLFNMAIRLPDYSSIRTLERQARTRLVANLNPQAEPPTQIRRPPVRGVYDPYARRPAAFVPDKLVIPVGQHGWTYAWCHANDLDELAPIPAAWYSSGVGAVTPTPMTNTLYTRVKIDALAVPGHGQVYVALEWPDRPTAYFHCHVQTVP